MSRHNRKRHVCEMCTAVFACDAEELPRHRFIVNRVLLTTCSKSCAEEYGKILNGVRPRMMPASYPGRRMGLPAPARIEHAAPLSSIIRPPKRGNGT